MTPRTLQIESDMAAGRDTPEIETVMDRMLADAQREVVVRDGPEPLPEGFCDGDCDGLG